jgi:hypothetical protein
MQIEVDLYEPQNPKNFVQKYLVRICLLFFGYFFPKFKSKICPQTFRLESSFIKSIPGLLLHPEVRTR